MDGLTHSPAYLAAKALWLHVPTPLAVLPMSVPALLLAAQASPAYIGRGWALAVALTGVALLMLALLRRNWLAGCLVVAAVVLGLAVMLVALSHQATANVGHRWVTEPQLHYS
jgi:hypothetical protein